MKYGVDVCIRELLFEQECTVIPGFGGFLTKYQSAQIDYVAYTIIPPTKTISFNRQLRNDDGLLVNTIALLNQIPFTDANTVVKKWVADFEHRIKSEKRVSLAKIGDFEWNDTNITISFFPLSSENYLSESYGFPTIIANPILRSSATSKQSNKATVNSAAIALTQESTLDKPFLHTKFESELTINEENIEKTNNFILACLGIALFLIASLPFFGIQSSKLNLNESNVFSVINTIFSIPPANVAPIALSNSTKLYLTTENELKVADPIFVNTTTKTNEVAIQQVPQEETEINEEPQKASPKYIVIMGLFKEKQNIQKMINIIQASNDSFEVLSLPKGNLTYVGIDAGDNESVANRILWEARELNADCWLKKNN